ncbi:MAG: hypothetical protein R6U89_04585 [Dehalococcoidia bacterium]
MTEIELEPDLSQCVQTRARREYERVMRQLLEIGEEDPDLAERLEILKSFLETNDFNKLRSEYEPCLVEGKTVRFMLWWESGGAAHRMEVL